MITKQLQAIEELRGMGYAVAVVCPDDLGPVSKDEAEEWMYDAVNVCRQIREEDERNGN